MPEIVGSLSVLVSITGQETGTRLAGSRLLHHSSRSHLSGVYFYRLQAVAYYSEILDADFIHFLTYKI